MVSTPFLSHRMTVPRIPWEKAHRKGNEVAECWGSKTDFSLLEDTWEHFFKKKFKANRKPGQQAKRMNRTFLLAVFVFWNLGNGRNPLHAV